MAGHWVKHFIDDPRMNKWVRFCVMILTGGLTVLVTVTIIQIVSGRNTRLWGVEWNIPKTEPNYAPIDTVSHIEEIVNAPETVTVTHKGSDKSHNVYGPMNGGVNGDVYTDKIKQRHFTDPILQEVLATCKDFQKPFRVRVTTTETESQRFRDEIVTKLKKAGYKDVEGGGIYGIPEPTPKNKNGLYSYFEGPVEYSITICPIDNTID